MEDFLAQGNLAGQTLLKLVSRGNAIIAEILRLSDFVPDAYRLNTKELQKRYAELLPDFTYFKSSEFYDQRIENNPDLLDLDDEFKNNNLQILTRFYLLFEGIYKYAKDLIRYVHDLEEGVFIQQTLESVFGSTDGKQLLIEALFLWGVMLLILDQRIDGLVRERMLVSYHRYKSALSGSTNLDDVCKLCRFTGVSVENPTGKRVPNYPEEYFKRMPIPNNFISMAISRLRSDDIYNQVSSYPNPDHRSNALSTQASMLYVILYFAPELLQNDFAKMREIVDKHFPDNWMVSYYMGFVVDLAETWDIYKAAKAALGNTTTIQNVKYLQDRYIKMVPTLIVQLQEYLSEGVLNTQYVLDHVPKLMNCLRDCNVTIRWLMLHTNTRVRKLQEMVVVGFSAKYLVQLLLFTSQFEFKLKNIFTEALKQKKDNWEVYKKEASERMIELSEYYSGEKALTRVQKDENLQAWFKDISNQINLIDFNQATMAGRKIVQLMQALEEVQEFHQLESNLQVRAFLTDTRGFLHQMLRTVNVKEEVLIVIQLVGDLSYGWQLINYYVTIMQNFIRKDAGNVLKLRAMFLKLASILDLPLVRISQANSRDVQSVAEYYSGKLVEFVRKVLQIIPASMFSILNQIVHIQTNTLKEVPTRLDKDKIKDFAQLSDRFELALRTYSISVFTEGMLAMETTLVGVVQVDPKQLLEDGIRRELVRHVAEAMNRDLVFIKSKPGDLEAKLAQLAIKLEGFRRSFEYIQDYVNIYALKIWQEELSRIINYYVERECNSFLKTIVHEWDSQFQSIAIPIPNFPPSDEQSVGFIGRLGQEIISLTDPSRTAYIHSMNAWYDRSKNPTEVVGLKTFRLLFDSIGTFGLTGLDRLYSFMIVRKLQRYIDLFKRMLAKDKNTVAALEQCSNELEPPSHLPHGGSKHYIQICSKFAKLFAITNDLIVPMGQLQLIRLLIGNELSFRCKLDSTNLADTLIVANDALINDIEMHYRNPDVRPYPKDDNPLLFELAGYLEASGLVNPFFKIYITEKPLKYFAFVVFLYVISQLPRFIYDIETNAFMSRNKTEPLDGTPFVVGILTLLKQFHVDHTHSFLAYMGQYIRAVLSGQKMKDGKDFPMEVLNALHFLNEFANLSYLGRKSVEKHVPGYLFNVFPH